MSNLQCHEGRGLLIYLKDSFNYCQIQTHSKFVEHLLFQLHLDSFKLNILAIYRSPNSTVQNNAELNTLISKVCQGDDNETIVVGDFNFPNINWNSVSTTKSIESPEYVLLQTIQDNFLYQHVTAPTRQRGSDNPSILDLVFSKNDVIADLTVSSPIGKSDHGTIKFNVNVGTHKISPVTKKLNFFKVDYDVIRYHLRQIDWLPLFETNDVNIAWEFFISNISKIISQCVPVYSNSIHKFKISRNYLSFINKKHRLWTKFMKNQTAENRIAYNRARNRVKNLSRQRRNKFENDLANSAKTNPKAIWKYINSRSKNNVSISCISSPSGDNITNEQEIVDNFNKFFASVYVNEPSDLPFVLPYNGQMLSQMTIEESVVLQSLKELDVNKPPGPDNIHPKFLYETAVLISKPLTHIFSLSLRSSILPAEWKVAKITPIFKTGNKSHTNNYRPISLNSNICKILEKLIRDKLMTHLVENNILIQNQFGFIPKKSTTLQLLLYLEKLTEAIENNKTMTAIYFDFQKAFDTVPHKRLIHKLSTVGITGQLSAWLSNYLSERSHFVQIGQSKSSLLSQTSGIPQGTILGPLLFLIYINDLPQNLVVNSLLFADDLKIFAINHPDNILQLEVQKISEWCSKWLLRFNPDKCKQISFGSDKVLPLTLDNAVIAHTTTQKDLGIMVDNKLNFDEHIELKVKKANQILGIIRRSFTSLSHNSFIKLYKALVRSHLEYGVSVWHPHKIKHIEMIESVQRRATRYLPGLKSLSYENRLKILNLPSLTYRRIRGDMIIVYKLLNNYYNVDPSLLINLKTYSDVRLTGRNHILAIFHEFCNKDTRKYFFTNRVAHHWNNLPHHVIFSPSLNTFKNRLDDYWDKIPFKYDYKAI